MRWSATRAAREALVDASWPAPPCCWSPSQVRFVGLSNETPYGLMRFCQLGESAACWAAGPAQWHLNGRPCSLRTSVGCARGEAVTLRAPPAPRCGAQRALLAPAVCARSRRRPRPAARGVAAERLQPAVPQL